MGALGRKPAEETSREPRAAGRRERSRADVQRRIKNILAVMRLLAVRTAETHAEMPDFLAHYTGRFDALARMLNASLRGDDEGMDLEEIVREELLAHVAPDYQITVEGPPVLLRHRVAQILALATHELAVNAVKFGALGVADGGRLAVTWRIERRAEGNVLRFEWREEGVPAIAATPMRYGMGRELIERGLPYEINAATHLDFVPGGVRCSIVVPCGEDISLGQEADL